MTFQQLFIGINIYKTEKITLIFYNFYQVYTNLIYNKKIFGENNNKNK